MWTYTKTDWKFTDFFEFEDYNRISANLLYVINLTTGFYHYWERPAITQLDISSLYFPVVLSSIENNLRLLADNTAISNVVVNTKTFIGNSLAWNFEDINRIETSIQLYYNMINSQIAGIKVLQFELGGEYFG